MQYIPHPQKQCVFLFRLFLINIILLANNVFAAEAESILSLSSIAVTGNPLGVGSDALIVPVSVLSGRELSFKRAETLGDTLDGIPGVSATHFGPHASRPVIRGLDAERVRIMQNGAGILDASSLSFDHAVAIDPLIIEQIDVVRGPMALLYGGSAVGGVVNVLDHRIPTEALDGIIGRTEARFGGADSQSNLATVVDVGAGKMVMHADAYFRNSSDLDIPGYAISQRKHAADATPRTNAGQLINSSANSNGGALGASMIFDYGYLGISYSGLNNHYGTVAEPTVRIDMRNDRWDLSSEFKELDGVFHRIKVHLAHTDYQHQEVDAGVVGTIFKNRGVEGAVEAGHTAIGLMQGVFGLQSQNTYFQASGDEAFVPNVNTQIQAFYGYEELQIERLKLSFGGRMEHVMVDAAEFRAMTAKNRTFNPNSYALGGLYTPNSDWSFTANLSHNERAPSYFELYANGAHLATGQYEVGNSDFSLEKSNGIDVQARWKQEKNYFNIGAYYTRFGRFLGLLETGGIDVDSALPIAQFSTFSANFKGLELEGGFNLIPHWDATLRGDYVHATNRDTGGAMPRMTPLRLGLGLHYQKDGLAARLHILHAFKQDRVAMHELATDGYTNISVLMGYKPPSKWSVELFAKADNLLNQEIREHASFLKDSAPQGSRSLLLGIRGDF